MFNIPQIFISDNERQFDCTHYQEWCIKLGIKVKYSSSGHPQANGQAEVTNKTLISTFKKKIGAHKEVRAKELPNVLWAY